MRCHAPIQWHYNLACGGGEDGLHWGTRGPIESRGCMMYTLRGEESIGNLGSYHLFICPRADIHSGFALALATTRAPPWDWSSLTPVCHRPSTMLHLPGVWCCARIPACVSGPAPYPAYKMNNLFSTHAHAHAHRSGLYMKTTDKGQAKTRRRS